MSVQLELFGGSAEGGVEHDDLGLQGLTYHRGFLSPDEQRRILGEVDVRPWRDDLRRRVQHYGYKYDYKARAVDAAMYVGALPEFAVEVAARLVNQGLIEEMPDQVIVNEYLPGQGITAHVDCAPCFKNTIVTVSLGSVYEIDFISLATGEVRSTLLELGSALAMRDEARYRWMHRIQARKSDRGIRRSRRVSLTFRNVILTD
jgi:alkylated DNA repair dioxygenase AlkB